MYHHFTGNAHIYSPPEFNIHVQYRKKEMHVKFVSHILDVAWNLIVMLSFIWHWMNRVWIIATQSLSWIFMCFISYNHVGTRHVWRMCSKKVHMWTWSVSTEDNVEQLYRKIFLCVRALLCSCACLCLSVVSHR